MRAVLLTQPFPPETHAGANRQGAFAEALAGRFDLTVVTIFPSYPTPRFHAATDWAAHDGERPYKVVRVTRFHPHAGSYLLRGLRELWLAVRLAWAARRLEADLVVATSPSIFTGPAALALARWKRMRFVWDIRDVTWSYAGQHGGRAARLAARLLERIVAATVRRADLVTCSNDGIAAAVQALGASPERVEPAYNGVSDELIERGRRVGDKPAGAPPCVMYAGAVGYYQGLATLLEVAARLPGVRFVIAGDGPERPMLEEQASARGLKNVELTGYLDREALFDRYREADVLFAQLKDLPSLNESTFPTKPFEYMAVGRPVLYAGQGIAAVVLAGTGAAVVVPPEDPDAIAGAIVGLLGDPDRRAEMSAAGRLAVEGFRREALMEAVAATLAGRFGCDADRSGSDDVPGGVGDGGEHEDL